MSSRFGILYSCLVLVCVSCSRRSNPDGEIGGSSGAPVVASVGGERITAAEFQAELERRSAGIPGGCATPKQRGKVLDELIRRKAALAKACASGLDRDPKVRMMIENLIATRYLEAEFAKRGKDSPVDEAEIVEFYQAHAAQFQISSAVRAGVITFKVSSKADTDKRDEVRARAESVRARAVGVDDAAFAQLVQENSEDQSTRYSGGDTGWLRAGDPGSSLPLTVVNAAFALRKSRDLAPIVQTPEGFYVVRLTMRHEATVRPLEQVREAVRFQIQQARRQQAEEKFFADLKRGLEITINKKVFNSIGAPKTTLTQAPPALPGG